MTAENGASMPKPSALWYIGHILLGIISGLICYILWHEKNKSAAKKHLIVSIILTFVPALIMLGISGLWLAASFGRL